MRILLDLQPCQSASRFRGIGRYSVELARAIAKNAKQHDIFLLLNAFNTDSVMAMRYEFSKLLPSENIVVFIAPGPVAEGDANNLWRSNAAELIRAHAIENIKPDIVHVSSLFEGYVDDVTVSIGSVLSDTLSAVTLYDLIPYKNPEAHLKEKAHRNWYRKKIKSLCRADLILAISEDTKKDAVELLEMDSDKIINIHAGVSQVFQEIDILADKKDKLYKKFNIQRSFLLCVGNLDPNKNLRRTIQAYALLPTDIRKQHQLIIVSQLDDEHECFFKQFVADQGLGNSEVVFTGYVSEDELVSLYNLCKAYILPSIHEGFGLPALEAMACGAATIGSNATSIPEVIGQKDALFNPRSLKSISGAMQRVLNNSEFRKSLRRHAKKQASNFSWDATANKSIRAMEKLVDSHKPKTYLASQEIYNNLINELADIKTEIRPTDRDLQLSAASISHNTVNQEARQLLIDVSSIVESDAKTGIQRVVRAVLSQMIDNPPLGYKISPVYADLKIGHYRYANKYRAKLIGKNTIGIKDNVIETQRRDIFLGLDLSAHLFPAFNSVLTYFRTVGVKIHFVVYDIIPIIYPEWVAPGMHDVFKSWIAAICSHADGMACISKAVADDLKKWSKCHPSGKLDEARITHFNLGADIDSSIPTRGMPENSKFILKKLIQNPTFLMVGTIEPRKGYEQALKAFEQLWEEGRSLNLVIVGKRGWQVKKLTQKLMKHKEENKNFFWLENISDEYLEKTYGASTCLIAASESEGFGLPIIEAAKHKLPVIARDLPVFREVAGEHAFYFRGNTGVTLAQAVRNWLTLYDKKQIPKSSNIKLFTWKQSAEQLKQIIFSATNS